MLHPWLKGELGALLAELEKQQPAETLPPEEQRPPAAQWKTWLWPHESAEGLPPLRIILVLDNLAGHLSPDLLGWFFHHGVMPLYTPVGGSWPEYWPNRCSASLSVEHSAVSIQRVPKR